MTELAAWDAYRLVLNTKQELEGYKRRFEGYFFNEKQHIDQQGAERFYTFFLLVPEKKYADIRLTVFVQEQLGWSPYRAPFGGLECAPETPPEAILFFLREVEVFLQKQSLHSLQITSFPFAYGQEAAQVITHTLLYQNYQIYRSELSYHLSVNALDFEDQIHVSEKRRLKKLRKHGFVFLPIANPEPEAIYDFVRNARLRKGFPVSLSLEQFCQLFRNFPQEFKAFTVEDSLGLCAALTVAVVINTRILYNFYPADHPDYLDFSPTVMLNEGLYNYAKAHHFELLDLGISTVHGEPNSGLIRFKKNLGAQTSLKLSFRKNLI